MQFDDSLAFYMNYPFLMPTQQEREQEQDLRKMQSFYSQRAAQIQEKVERECDLMEYDGSIMFDEYPDKFMMEHLCRKIERELEKENELEAADHKGDSSLRDLIGVLLFNEMFRRRCRRRKCRRFF